MSQISLALGNKFHSSSSVTHLGSEGDSNVSLLFVSASTETSNYMFCIVGYNYKHTNNLDKIGIKLIGAIN